MTGTMRAVVLMRREQVDLNEKAPISRGFAEPSDGLSRRQIRTATLARLDPPHVLPQRLGRQPEISRDVRDRTPGLEHQPPRALQQLDRVLPRPRHDSWPYHY